MNLPTHDLSGIKIAAVNGRIDRASTHGFASELTRLLNDCRADGRALLLDFAGVEYISSVDAACEAPA